MSAAAIAGRRILVTRAAEDAERWAERIERLGASPVIFPCIVYKAIADGDTASALSRALADPSWLLAFSVRGVAAVAALIGDELPAWVRLAAVGPATARACASRFGRVDLIAAEATAAGLGRELAAFLARAAASSMPNIVVAGAAGGRVDAEAALAAHGIGATRVDVYRTIPLPPTARKHDLAADRVDDVLLASPSAVTGLVNRAVVPADARVITIGPTTSLAAAAAGIRVAAEARDPTLDGMLEALS